MLGAGADGAHLSTLRSVMIALSVCNWPWRGYLHLEIGRCYKSERFSPLGEPVVEHLPARHSSYLSIFTILDIKLRLF